MKNSCLSYGLLALMFSISSEASTCIRLTNSPDGALVVADKAELVLLGRVVERVARSWWKDGASKVSITLTVEPIEIFKGRTDSTKVDLTPGLNSSFNVGNIYLIFAFRHPQNKGLFMDSCSSTPYELDPPGAGFENAKLRTDLAPILDALREDLANAD